MTGLSSKTDVALELIERPERFMTIAPAWQALWSRTEGSVFQSHAWLSAWWTSFGSVGGSKLHVAVAWCGDAALAILPFAITRKWGGTRTLVWAGEAVSDYCDALVVHGHERGDVLGALWAKVRRDGGFDLIDLKQVRPGANVARLLTQSCSGRKALRTRGRSDISFQVINHGLRGGEAYFRSLSKKARNNHSRGKRILSETGQVTSRLVSNSEIVPFVERLFELKARWIADTRSDWPLLAAGPAGLVSLAEAAAALDKLAAFVLEVDGTAIATSFNIMDGQHLLAFVTAYDPVFKRASPGTVLMVDYVVWAFDAGCCEVDFLRGDEPFKLIYANTRTGLSSYLGPQTIRGTGLIALYRLKQGFERILKPARWRNTPAATGSTTVASLHSTP